MDAKELIPLLEKAGFYDASDHTTYHQLDLDVEDCNICVDPSNEDDVGKPIENLGFCIYDADLVVMTFHIPREDFNQEALDTIIAFAQQAAKMNAIGVSFQ
jgi:hypothetical protein